MGKSFKNVGSRLILTLAAAPYAGSDDCISNKSSK